MQGKTASAIFFVIAVGKQVIIAIIALKNINIGIAVNTFPTTQPFPVQLIITDSEERKQSIQDFLPDVVAGKTKPSGQVTGNTKEQLKDFLGAEDVSGESNVTGKGSKETVDSIDTNDTGITKIPETTVQTEPEEPTVQTAPKRISGKQRKVSLEEYRETFLTVPKIEDRKPVFVSRDSRDRLDEIARRLGGRGMSVSGLIENLVLHHLEIYREDLEAWKKL